jgi:DNA-binding MarR family transcriptional regulator
MYADRLSMRIIYPVDRPDLGYLFARIARQLRDAEQPLLAAHGLTMWEYIVMSELARRHAQSQLSLANAVDYDKTRLISLLDELERRELLTREQDPTDRRARIVRLTPAGVSHLADVRRKIRAMERDMLKALSQAETKTLLAVLPRLIEKPSR